MQFQYHRIQILNVILQVARSVMKSGRIIHIFLVSLLIVYMGGSLVLNNGKIRGQISGSLSSIAGKALGGTVTMDDVSLTRPCGIKLNDVTIISPASDTIARIGTLDVRMRLLPLLRKQIRVSGVRLLGPDIRVSRDSLNGDTNLQYIIDKFAKDTTRQKKGLPDIRVNSVIIRNGRLRYDVADQPVTDSILNKSHIDLRKLNANISLKALSADTACISIRRLVCEEASGLALHAMEAEVKAGKDHLDITDLLVRTSSSRLSIDKAFLGAGLDGAIPEDLALYLSVRESRVNPSDFKAIVPSLGSFNDRLRLSAEISGSINDLNISRLALSSGDGETVSLRLRGNVSGPYDKAMALNGMTASLSTGSGLYEWASQMLSGFGITLPQIVRTIGASTVNIFCNGDMDNNRLECNITSAALGNLSAHIATKDGIHDATVNSGQIRLGQITGSKDLGSAILSASVQRLRIDSVGVSGDIRVSVPSIEFRQYTYRDIAIAGKLAQDRYDIEALVSDVNAVLSASASWLPQTGELSAAVNVDTLNLAETNLMTKDSVAIVSGNIAASLTGKEADKMRGRITVNDLAYTNSSGTTPFHTVELMMRDVIGDQLVTSLTSELMNATITGHYSPTTLAHSLTSVISKALPSLYSKITPAGKAAGTYADNQFDIALSINKTDLPLRLLNIPLELNDMVILNASVDDKSGKSRMYAVAPSITFKDQDISGASIVFDSSSDTLSLSLNGEVSKGIGKPTGIHAFVGGHEDRLSGLMTWKSGDEGEFEGSLLSSATFGPYDARSGNLRWQADIDNTTIKLNGTDWHIDNTTVVSDSSRFDIKGLSISHGNQYLRADGTVSADSASVLRAELSEIDLGEIMGMTGKNKLGLSGITSGKVYARSILAKPVLYGNIGIEDLRLMNTGFGDVSVDGRWNNDTRTVGILASIDLGEDSLSRATGTYSPATDSIDISIEAHHLDLCFLNSLLPKSVFNELRGHTTTIQDMRLAGTTKRFNLEGVAFLENAFFDVAPNNCKYRVEGDTLRFVPDKMIFSDIHVQDEAGNKALLDCIVEHNHLKNITVDLGIRSEGVKVFSMPRTDAAQFYGDVYAGGTPHLSTQPGLTLISGNARTARGTEIHISPTFSNAVEYQFLTIRDPNKVNEVQEQENSSKAPKNNSDALRINLNLGITEDASIHADMSSISGYTHGSGNVIVNYNKRDGTFVYGDFNATGGKCTLSLQQLLRKEFNIMNDSRVVFNGNIASSTLDIHTSYIVNSVALNDLDASANSSSHVRVRCLMDVTGNISNPQLAFNVDLPQGSAEDKEIVAGATATEEQRNMQFMYLLAVGKFYTYDNAGNDGAAFTTSTAMESLLNSTVNGQINNLLSQVINSDNITLSSNVSTAYLAEDKASFVDNTFEGILEARLLNNRLLINGNFGYRESTLNNTSNFIGDVEVKYLLLPKIGVSLFGYNRNNQRYFTKTTLNTQGIGVAYETNFDRFIKPKEKAEKAEK